MKVQPELQALTDAWEIIHSAHKEVVYGPSAVSYKLNHAEGYIDAQIKELLEPPPAAEVRS